ncbi:MAG TPA: DNA replication and repair protein RecF [Anaerolineales bacterium]|nr:DNA replication and repair protein RecF [Anaerolineales bacterium]
MYLTRLSLTNLRNFARLDVEVPRGPILLVGENAQGKTSFLEAIFFLATFVSFHAGSDRELVNFIASREPLAVARIIADFNRQERSGTVGSHRLEVRLIQETNGFNGQSRLRKEILVDGAKRKASEAIGLFNAVIFLPQTLRIIEGSPEERRRYLNLTLAQVIPGYADTLSNYNQLLSQRNALLKQVNEGSADPGQLSFWNEHLSLTGSRLIHARIQAIQELERFAANTHLQLTRGSEVLRLDYQPAYDPQPQPEKQIALPVGEPFDRSGLSEEKIRQGFLENLIRLHAEEISRGITTIGPHRDELRFLGNRVDLGTYGSRGQARTAMLSLKLAEVEWMREKTGQWPVLLLDEVLAELDAQRRSDLLDRLVDSEQTLLTTTDLDLFSSDFVERSSLWRIQAGRLI